MRILLWYAIVFIGNVITSMPMGLVRNRWAILFLLLSLSASESKYVSDKDEFDNQLKESGSKLVVVFFFATWCGPCKMIAPTLEEYAKPYTDVIVLKVDVDECEDIVQEYNITAMPTFIFIKDGKKQDDDLMGANPDKLKELVQKYRGQ